MVVVSGGGWLVSLVMLAALVAVVALMARAFWRTARGPDDDRRDDDR
jgi:hypothetical protein